MVCTPCVDVGVRIGGWHVGPTLVFVISWCKVTWIWKTFFFRLENGLGFAHIFVCLQAGSNWIRHLSSQTPLVDANVFAFRSRN